MEAYSFTLASKWKRLVHKLIDSVAFLVLCFMHALIFDTFLHVIPEKPNALLGVYVLFLFVFYHFIFEYLWGKTPGKFLTKSIVVDKFGCKPSTLKLLIRSICRLLPLNTLSFIFLYYGFHDTISGTFVIKEQ